jgi:hypothetical protein
MMKKEKLVKYIHSALKVLFSIWLPSFLINTVFSLSILYRSGSIALLSFVNQINKLSENVAAFSGSILYLTFLFWCVLSYQEIKGLILNLLRRFKLRLRKENAEPKTTTMAKESSPKDWCLYASLFLMFILLTDTFFYDWFTSQFRGDTLAHAMPKRAVFTLMLNMTHQFRTVFWIALSISTVSYTLLFLMELFKRLKRKG